MNKILFLDMDHTFIQPKEGKSFPDDHTDWEFIIHTKNKILEFYNKGYKIVVISNQGGIENRKETHDGLALKFESIKAAMGIPIDFFYCSTTDKNDPMRKPNTGMADKAAELYDIDWKNSIMVGDASGLKDQFSDSDKMFAKNAGICTYYDVSEFQNDIIEDYTKVSDELPEKGKDLSVILNNGEKRTVFRCSCPVSKCKEWKCTTTGLTLMVDVVKWKYLKE